MLEYDVAIVGGGPAGIMAAIASLKNTGSVILLEKNSSLGRKFLLTGGGNCNITNLKPLKKLLEKYDAKNFLKHSFYTFTNEDLLSMFPDIGFYLKDHERVFPKNADSRDILNILTGYLEGAVIRYNFEVKSITDDFIINDEIKAKNIIIATGGITYPQTGCNITSYSLTTHPLTDIKYGLSPLITRRDTSSISGVVLNDVEISYQKKVRENLLFSHVGISGPGVIDLSNEISKSITYNLLETGPDVDLKIRIDLLPDITHDNLSQEMTHDFQNMGKMHLKNYLKKFITKSFIKFFLDETGIDENISLSQITRKNKNLLVEKLKNFPLEITGFNEELSKVTIGGVDLKYINPKTMESKLIPNLYFAGEVLDLHGPTGGYNLKIAFSTGYLAGISAGNK